ncbi:hypothetical protein IW138_005606 [Coemansia sp. RSA 986]|nr:hypothetical protein IW138_005606 [Coemansia sp. RSA 986]
MFLGGANMVWIKGIPADDCLAEEVKRYAVVLETLSTWQTELKSNKTLMLIDPLLYPLDYELSHLLPSVIESPDATLKLSTFGDKPESFGKRANVVVNPNKGMKTDEDFYPD